MGAGCPWREGLSQVCSSLGEVPGASGARVKETVFAAPRASLQRPRYGQDQSSLTSPGRGLPGRAWVHFQPQCPLVALAKQEPGGCPGTWEPAPGPWKALAVGTQG